LELYRQPISRVKGNGKISKIFPKITGARISPVLKPSERPTLLYKDFFGYYSPNFDLVSSINKPIRQRIKEKDVI
jgi:hypothetical protein